MSTTNTQARYQNGKIYKLVSDHTDKIYIGSTCMTLPKRLHQHKNNYKMYLKGKMTRTTAFDLLALGEVDIILVENYACHEKNELLARERYWIDLYKDTRVNKNIPTRSTKEYNDDNKEKHKEYFETHRERIKARTKKCYEAQKTTINEHANEKHMCACGGRYANRRKAAHMRTQKHHQYVENTVP